MEMILCCLSLNKRKKNTVNLNTKKGKTGERFNKSKAEFQKHTGKF